MVVFGGIGVLLLFIVGVQIVHAYNKLVMAKHNVQAAWSNIDVVLKQRNDELPKLVQVVKEYVEYERDLLQQLVRARDTAARARERQDPGSIGFAESSVRAYTQRVLAVAEAYPALKSDHVFIALTKRISELEAAIADRRTFYNDTVRINNEAVEQFPENLFAGRFGFERVSPFRFDSVVPRRA